MYYFSRSLSAADIGRKRNLQRIPPNRHIPLEELEYEGHDIYFYDDLESLSNVWLSNNLDNSGQLLIEFFKFFSKDFLYNAHVISIRSEGGLISKEAKGWPTEVSIRREGF